MSAPTTELRPLDPEALLALSSPLALVPNTIHVWAFGLEGPPDVVEKCRDLLSDPERRRADRFVFPKDRIHHTVAHGVLRHLLGLYCGVTPDALAFETTASGKPSLQLPGAGAFASLPGSAVSPPPPGGAPSPLHFNLSHSGGRGLLGVSTGHELGIDIERVRPDLQALDISKHYFFGAEREAIEGALSVMRDSTFFRYWVAKEAVLKAQGVGLGFPLDQFCIHFRPEGDAAHIETLDPAVLEPDWTVRMLSCDEGWAAAVVARGNDWDVRVERPI